MPNLLLSACNTLPHSHELVIWPTLDPVPNFLPRCPKGPTNWWAVPSLASSSILLPLTPECLWSQMSLTERWAERSSNALWHFLSKGYVVLTAWRAFKAAWPSEQILIYFSKLFISVGQQPLVDQIILIIKTSRSHSATLRSVGLLWANDQPDAIDIYLTNHDTYKKHTSILSACFEPTILVSEGLHTHARPLGASLWPNSRLNFTDAGEDGIHISGEV